MLDWSDCSLLLAEFIVVIVIPVLYLFQKKKMSFPSRTSNCQQQQCPPPPPSSPIDHSRRQRNATAAHSQQFTQQQQQQQRQQQNGHNPPFAAPQQEHEIANLLQYAQSSYTTNPTYALTALMDALTLTTGTNAAAQHAMHRIRSELGDAVADSVTGSNNNNNHLMMPHQQQQYSQQQTSPLSEQEMTLRAMAIVQELLSDTSTILYGQGKQHLLQQAMEDGSSVVCSKCGDVVSKDRWAQHSEYWCRAVEGESMMLDG
mmetsp:Transcript_8223/g.14862  ORF Transcript_8223/g.14862 Transcript_8223/m.14862 type:complete len:259 (-) Transcript_8223:459-1235(-)